ncbi:MAG: DUF2264 domain-containing protein [Asticcacaulis sp.]|nr:DUF2264 domain-containing protein [Asticcacaulis sp.]
MKRRDLMKAMLAAPALAAVSVDARPAPVADDRAYMTGLLAKIAAPVLSNMSQGRLHQAFTPELSPIWDGRNRRVAYLECFGRLMSGLAPWLSLPDDATSEGRQRAAFREQALMAYAHSVDPASPDCLLWKGEGQALVDAAFYCRALVRAPNALWAPLDSATKTRIVATIKSLRSISPPYTNWLLFAAMNEAFLLSVGEDWDPLRVDLAIRKMGEWYAGDGWTGDGPRFHFDYYNSYVIWPMLVEVLEVAAAHGATFNALKPVEQRDIAMKRMQRYGEELERMISPEGTWPPIGRSLTYRTAAFQPLGLLAWRKALPPSLPEGQVRAALMAAQRRIFSDPSNFDAQGYLTIGFAGHRPEIGDSYSNSGSMYIVSESFLALGLAPDDSFWTVPALPWTAKKAFANAPFPRDHYSDT